MHILKSNIFVEIVLFVIVGLLIISKKFTQEITVTEKMAQIVYFKWAIKKNLELEVSRVRTEIRNEVAIRGYKHKFLNIYYDNRLKYSIDSGDGFNPDDLELLDKEISDRTNSNNSDN